MRVLKVQKYSDGWWIVSLIKPDYIWLNFKGPFITENEAITVMRNLPLDNETT